MSVRFSGKNVVVAGSTTGIGRAIALRFLDEGARVAVNAAGNRPRDFHEFSLRGDAVYIKADLGCVVGAKSLIRQARRSLGRRLDYLIYAAGVYPEGDPSGRSDAELWELTYAVKVRGSYLAALEFAAESDPDSEDRAIVFVSSINARQSEPNHLAYDGACAAVEGQTRSFAVEYAGRGIRVNCLAPGLIATALTADVVQDSRLHAHARRCIPLGRIGRPIDCAGAATFLCSVDAEYITGQVITVDGGIEALQAPEAG